MNTTPSRSARAGSSRRLVAFSMLGACLLLGALAGCGDDNPVKTLPPGPKYLPSSTPQNTLENMAKAYSTRDSTGYDTLFDAGYTGTSFDPATLNPLTFTKTNEAQHISALARTHTITSVTFQYPPSVVRDRDSADPPGWALIRLQNVLLEINDTPNSYTITPSVTQEFKFAPTTPSFGSPTDTTWHIVRWAELP